jgi:hypothetical protein
MKVYRIRNCRGEYIGPGQYNANKVGKIWDITRLKGHLALYGTVKRDGKIIKYECPHDYVIEEYELIKTNEYNAQTFK